MGIDGFDMYKHFPTEVGFAFFQEIEKLGFKEIKNSSYDAPTEYEGIVYDYFNNENAVIRIFREEKRFQGLFQKEIQIFKNDTCIYKGVIPSSHFTFNVIMSHILPSESFIKQFEEDYFNNDSIKEQAKYK